MARGRLLPTLFNVVYARWYVECNTKIGLAFNTVSLKIDRRRHIPSLETNKLSNIRYRSILFKCNFSICIRWFFSPPTHRTILNCFAYAEWIPFRWHTTHIECFCFCWWRTRCVRHRFLSQSAIDWEWAVMCEVYAMEIEGGWLKRWDEGSAAWRRHIIICYSIFYHIEFDQPINWLFLRFVGVSGYHFIVIKSGYFVDRGVRKIVATARQNAHNYSDSGGQFSTTDNFLLRSLNFGRYSNW